MTRGNYMVKDTYIKRVLGHFENIARHTTRPYEPTPSHLKKRLLSPFCADISALLKKGTKNDFEQVLEGISNICKKYIHP